MTSIYIPQQLRRLVRERAQNRCEYCLSPESHATQGLSLEHIIPRDLGGLTAAENLAASCQGCNNSKYIKTSARDPLSGQDAPLHHPRRDVWAEHFAWSPDHRLMLGLTPTGRATIAALKLNRVGVVNLRHLLMLIGQHPPSQP